MDRDAWATAAESLQRHAALHLLLAGALFLGMFELSPALLTELRDRLLPQDATLVYLSPAEYMLLRFRLAGYAAICGLALTTGIDAWITLRGRLTADRPGIGSVTAEPGHGDARVTGGQLRVRVLTAVITVETA